MNPTHTRKKAITATVGIAIAGMAAPALLFLGAGTAQAIPCIEWNRICAHDVDVPPDWKPAPEMPKPWCDICVKPSYVP